MSRTSLQRILVKDLNYHPYKIQITQEMLKAIFPNRLISRFGDVPWPPRSPDLSAPDFFLWGYLKGKVYIEMPDTLQQLKRSIIQEINNISPEALGK